MTLVLLTLGASPLAVVVAAHSLHKAMLEIGEAHSLVLCYSPQVRKHADRVRSLLLALGVPLSSVPIVFRTDDLSDVYRKIEQRLREEPDVERVHLHYTGGLKPFVAQGVEALETVAALNRDISVEYSYLDAKRHAVLQRRNRLLLPVDERMNLALTVKQLAEVHGYAEFQERTADVDVERIELGRRLTEFLILSDVENRLKHFLEWIDRRKYCKETAPYVAKSEQETWDRITRDVTAYFNGKRDKVLKFIEGRYFEYFVFAQLRDALRIAGLSPDIVRFDVEIRSVADDGTRGVPFQIDLLCSYGYQALAVSCTTSILRVEQKLKAFEVARRARQLGGSEGRALLICPMAAHEAQRLQEDVRLEDTSVSDEVEHDHLQVWGIDKVRQLDAEFASYVEDSLKWRAG